MSDKVEIKCPNCGCTDHNIVISNEHANILLCIKCNQKYRVDYKRILIGCFACK